MRDNPFFPEIHGNFGFGCMRLPMKGEEVDLPQFTQMVDTFLKAGLNYFDTASVYIQGKSETALREALTSRYPRDRFVFTNKLSGSLFEKEEDIRPLVERQLKSCGLEYFDFYLMHAQGAGNYGKYKACRAYEIACELKAEGKIRHVGMSFHDTAQVLDQILTEQPGVEVVQLQFNYMDYEDEAVQSRKCYEVCVKHGKPVLVMEPVKGGRLASLHPEAGAILDALGGGSHASYAVRFAAGFEKVAVVLSGMSDIHQMEDNLSFMTDFQPLNDKERKAVDQVAKCLRALPLVPCTKCRYCVDGCPMSIDIPRIFSVLNTARMYPGSGFDWQYASATEGKGKASDCVKCGQCEKACPQHLPIRALLEEAAGKFEQ